MLNELLNVVKSPLGWVTRRILSSLKVHVQKARVAGEQKGPALVITVTVENPQSENTFVSRFEVRMLEPCNAMAVRYEFRDAQAEGIVKTLPLNIPGFGMSEALTVIAHFDQSMAAPSGRYRARIAGVGRSGFRKRFSDFEGEFPWQS